MRARQMGSRVDTDLACASIADKYLIGPMLGERQERIAGEGNRAAVNSYR